MFYLNPKVKFFFSLCLRSIQSSSVISLSPLLASILFFHIDFGFLSFLLPEGIKLITSLFWSCLCCSHDMSKPPKVDLFNFLSNILCLYLFYNYTIFKFFYFSLDIRAKRLSDPFQWLTIYFYTPDLISRFQLCNMWIFSNKIVIN